MGHWYKDKNRFSVLLTTIIVLGFLLATDSNNFSQLISKSYAEDFIKEDSQLTYNEKTRAAMLQIDSVSGYTEQLGFNFMADPAQLEKSIEHLQLMEFSLAYYDNDFEDDKIPENYYILHSSLISGLDHMQQSMSYLKSSLEKIQLVNGIMPDMISFILGAAETQMPDIYDISKVNQTERDQIENARTLFYSSLDEASLMTTDLDDFISNSDGNFNSTSYQNYKKYQSYFGSTFNCPACFQPINFPES